MVSSPEEKQTLAQGSASFEPSRQAKLSEGRAGPVAARTKPCSLVAAREAQSGCQVEKCLHKGLEGIFMEEETLRMRERNGYRAREAGSGSGEICMLHDLGSNERTRPGTGKEAFQSRSPSPQPHEGCHLHDLESGILGGKSVKTASAEVGACRLERRFFVQGVRDPCL